MSASGQLENDVEYGGRIRRLAIPQCRFEVDLFRSSNGGFIETVA
jgi:hypothetical protein